MSKDFLGEIQITADRPDKTPFQLVSEDGSIHVFGEVLVPKCKSCKFWNQYEDAPEWGGCLLTTTHNTYDQEGKHHANPDYPESTAAADCYKGRAQLNTKAEHSCSQWQKKES